VLACAPEPELPGSVDDSTSGSSEETTSATETTEVAGTSSSSDDSGGTTGEGGDGCPLGIAGMENQKVRLLVADDWPWSDPPEELVDANCTPVSAQDGNLQLSCSPLDDGSNFYPITVATDRKEVSAFLATLADFEELALSFSGPIGFFPSTGVGAYHSLRTLEGELLLLGVNSDLGAGIDSIGPDGWTVPLGPFSVDDPECEYRPALREGAELEKPLSLLVGADGGTTQIFDRETATVQGNGEPYTVYLFDAFERGESGCASDCLVSEINFAILRGEGRASGRLY
jgi:hypothetical protein